MKKLNYNTNKYNTNIILKYLIISIISFLFLYVTYNLFKLWNNIWSNKSNLAIEQFADSDYDLIISKWDNGSGFYSQLLFKLNHYLYCKKHNINFKTNSDNWQYKYKHGWTDYFEDVTLNLKNIEKPRTNTIGGCCTILEQFPLRDYVSTLKEYYKYNPKTIAHIKKVKSDLNLVDGEYGAIYIRRGDKLVDEIKFIPSSKFAQLLLSKYPECTTIFVQTDDYNSYQEVKEYVEDKYNDKIKVLTLCPSTNFGSIAHGGYVNKMKNDDISTLKEGKEVLSENKEYIKKIQNNLAKPISEMNPKERYEHTMELLTGVDICTKSKICVCDYKSNVSRFIKIAHNDFNSVFDVNDTDLQINLDTLKCPGFDFDSKHNS